MRIIAGSKKGLRLQSPSGDVSRPILDRVKESLYSVLYHHDLPAEACVADLFSGVGSLGLEALSRGASWVTFAERDAQIQQGLRANIRRAGFEDRSTVVGSDAYAVGALLVPEVEKYDLVFVDPPYPTTENVGADSALAGLLNILPGQIAADGLVVVRTQKRTHLLERYGELTVSDRRTWGKMAIHFLRRQPATEEDPSTES
jgi:16S rRNA (guanine(966)-N(2))-methyltransferase RsmD